MIHLIKFGFGFCLLFSICTGNVNAMQRVSPSDSKHPARAIASGDSKNPTNSEMLPADRYREQGILGEGTFGTVYLMLDQVTGKLVAVKKVHLRTTSPKDTLIILERLQHEISVMRRSRHPYSVDLLSAYHSEKTRTFDLVMEFAAGNSIDYILTNGNRLPFKETVIRKYVWQLLQVLAHSHKNGVIHRDLKGKNVLIDQHGNVKLADWGSAKVVDDILKMYQPSLHYSYTVLWLAPEVAQAKSAYNYKVDIWSLGCVIIEMASGKEPWAEMDFGTHFEALATLARENASPARPSGLSATGLDFLNKCLVRDPAGRWSAEQLLEHPWIQLAIEEAGRATTSKDGDQYAVTEISNLTDKLKAQLSRPNQTAGSAVGTVAPRVGYAAGPTAGYTPAPTTEYTPAPTTGYTPAPTTGYTPAPTTGYTPAPTVGPTVGVKVQPPASIKRLAKKSDDSNDSKMDSGSNSSNSNTSGFDARESAASGSEGNEGDERDDGDVYEIGCQEDSVPMQTGSTVNTICTINYEAELGVRGGANKDAANGLAAGSSGSSEMIDDPT